MIVNLLLSVFSIVLSSIILTQTSKYPNYAKMSVIGPEVIPNCIAYFMIAVAVYLIVVELVKCIRGCRQTPTYTQKELARSREIVGEIMGNKRGLLRIIGTLVLMFLFASLLNKIGFELCAIIFLVGCMLMNGVRKVWILILVPVLTIAVVYFGFFVALKVNIPLLFL